MSIQPIQTTPNTPVAQEAPQSFGMMERVETKTTRTLEEWANELDRAFAIAQKISGTMFAPKHFRGKPQEAAAAILYGDTLGMPPMISLRTIYEVHGTPALYAQQMFAIAISAGHEIERVHADNERVEFRARRRGQKEWQKVEWTIERARQAKYTSNSKYQENPIGMLTEKCKAEAAKLVAPDALAGMNSVEEIQLGDFEDLGEVVEPPAVVEKPAPAGRKINRKAKAQPVAKEPEPTTEPEPAPEVVEETGEIVDDTPAVLETDWDQEIKSLAGDHAALLELWNRASAEGAPQEVINKIIEAGQQAGQ